MTNEQSVRISHMVDRLIAFIKWKGAVLENKEKKIIKELSLIRQYSLECMSSQNSIPKERSDKVPTGH